MRRFVTDRVRRAVAASLRAATRPAPPSPAAPARALSRPSPSATSAMASYMARSMTTSAAGAPPMSLDIINPKVLEFKYVVRGEIVTHAQKYHGHLMQEDS